MNKPKKPVNRSTETLSRRVWFTILAIVILLTLGGYAFSDWWSTMPEGATATYVGRDSCIKCHQPEHAAWHGSHHDLAMDLATDETVLGDFDDAELEVFGQTSKMFKRDDKFMIHTEGPDGVMTDFEIKYVFGVDPLQQYMVEFDRPKGMPANEISRVQVLRISWDTRKKAWFYLPPPDVKDEKLDPSDDLHWTGIAQRWNNMCADCHSTNLQKNFDVKTATYHTTFSEIDVSCESCHGAGSLHVEMAESNSLFWDRKLGYGLAKLKGKDNLPQIETCAQCHSRRRRLHPEYHPGAELYDQMANELLGRQTYFCDGQIMDEVYVHGSFVQSKMYHKGIRCTDCHDPHSLQLKFEDNRLCTSCHEHDAAKLDGTIHHFHKDGSTGAKCVECHMPETTYMEVDPRRDHSLRVPRPDLSVEHNTPNACSRCHLKDDRPNKPQRDKFVDYAEWVRAARDGDEEVADYLHELDKWAAKKTREWYPEGRHTKPHYADTLAAAHEGGIGAKDKLVELAKETKIPSIVRATALQELSQYFDYDRDTTIEVLEASASALKDDDPQIVATAISNLQAFPLGRYHEDPDERRRLHNLAVEKLMDLLGPLLDHPVRLVRIEAARVLARIPSEELRGRDRKRINAALDEYEAGVLLSGDRAGAHMTLAMLYETQNRTDDAINAYETAIRVEPQATGPRTNLAALYDREAETHDRKMRQTLQEMQQFRVQQRAAEGESWFEQRRKELRDKGEKAALKAGANRERAAFYRAQELPNLARDAKLAPESAPIQYRYGLALYLHGDLKSAEGALKNAVEIEPDTPEFARGLTLLYQKLERYDEALKYCNEVLRLRPNDQAYRNLKAELEQKAAVGKPE